MPIISIKRFYDHLLNPLSYPRPDITMLLFCMKLILWSPSQLGSDPKTPAYRSAKQFLLDAEITGMLTVQLLQARLLVSLYELGHAIYPAAYMSIGACAKCGLALGLERPKTAHLNEASLTSLTEEERRRVWWTCVILDRYDSPSLSPFELLPVYSSSIVAF